MLKHYHAVDVIGQRDLTTELVSHGPVSMGGSGCEKGAAGKGSAQIKAVSSGHDSL
jgi:hypothetical protein